LLKILFFQKRILIQNVFAMRIGYKEFQHPAHCDTHAANARFPAAFSGFNRDAIENANLRHVSSVPESDISATPAGSSLPDSEFTAILSF